MKWRERAACRGMGPDLFFPGRGALPAEYEAAKEFCRECPVINECLDYVLTENDGYNTPGIWAATTQRQRRRMRTRAT